MKIKEHIKAIAADLYLAPANLIATSAETGYGKDDVLQKIAEVIELQSEPVYVDEDEEDDEPLESEKE